VFWAGIGATFAMAAGTAITTGGLACLAVFAKRAAMRFAVAESSSATILARGLELAAALGVLAFGVAMILGGAGGA
jgi:nickel/cobalt exporter